MEKNFEGVNEKLERIEKKLDALKEAGIAVPAKAARGVQIAGDGVDSNGVKVPAPPKEGRKPMFADTPAETQQPRVRGVRIADDQSPATTSIDPSEGGSKRGIQFSMGDRRASVSPQIKAQNSEAKKRASAAKQKRKEFFDHLVWDGQWNSIPKSATVRCNWLGCAAMAIHFVSGVDTTIEQVLKNNKMAMHYVTFPSVTLPELADSIDEFVTTATTMDSLSIRSEVATFDINTVDELGDELGTGDRLPITSLTAFRKELQAAMQLDDSVYIFNYDPFIVQENEMRNDEDEDDDEDESGDGSGSPTKKKPVQWSKKNYGAFAMLLNFNPALHTVTLATPHIDEEGKTHLETHMCSVQTLYNSCVAKDGYSKRSRGFVRVFKAHDEDHHNPVTPIYPINLVDGRSANGMLSIALDIAIAPHILGLAITHHIVAETMLPKQQTTSKLRGIPVSDICTELGLPVHIITGGSNNQSLATAFAWYHEFLTRKGIIGKASTTAEADTLNLGIVQITRKGGAEDGMPSLLDEEFFTHVVEAVASKSVMLINFDINIAQNVMVEAPPNSPSHFAIVVGIDEERGIVRLADVSVKKYRKMWHVPLVRLYNAAIGFGYMIISKDAAVASQHEGIERGQKLLGQARNSLPPQLRLKSMFEFPRKNYNVTILASVLTQMGYPTTVEDIVYNSGFHISFLLSEHIPLRDVVRIMTHYSHVKLSNNVKVTPLNFDKSSSARIEDFENQIKTSCADDNQFLLVNYNTIALQGRPKIWNGSSGGPLAVVVAYDEATKTVTLSDSNPESFYRTWNCPADDLFAIAHDADKISNRARGWILVEKAPAGAVPSVDMRTSMVHHPFKPPVSSRASAIALAASQLTKAPHALEDVIYSTATFSLQTLSLGDDVDRTVEMAAEFLAAEKLSEQVSISTVSAADAFKAPVPDVNVTVFVALYKHSVIIPEEAGVGAAIVVSVSEDGKTAELLDGNQTHYGNWSVPVEKLLAEKNVVGVLKFTKNA